MTDQLLLLGKNNVVLLLKSTGEPYEFPTGPAGLVGELHFDGRIDRVAVKRPTIGLATFFETLVKGTSEGTSAEYSTRAGKGGTSMFVDLRLIDRRDEACFVQVWLGRSEAVLTLRESDLPELADQAKAFEDGLGNHVVSLTTLKQEAQVAALKNLKPIGELIEAYVDGDSVIVEWSPQLLARVTARNWVLVLSGLSSVKGAVFLDINDEGCTFGFGEGVDVTDSKREAVVRQVKKLVSPHFAKSIIASAASSNVCAE